MVLVSAGATPWTERFESANRLYKQGAFDKAARAYADLIADGHQTAPLYFNWGNAALQAGEPGQAIAAYGRARQLAPRDQEIQRNLAHAAEIAGQSDSPLLAKTDPQFLSFTLNEWTLITTFGFWGFLGLLAFREWHLRPAAWTRIAVRAAGTVTLILACLLAGSLLRHTEAPLAIVTKPKTQVRFGPLNASEIRYTLPDGTPVEVIAQRVGWLKVRLPNHPAGWLESSHVAWATPRASRSRSS